MFVLPFKASTWLPTAPVIMKAAGLPVVVSIIQSISPPAPAGSGSLSVTPVAVAEPVLLMVTVKPATLPGVTVAESAVLATVSCGIRVGAVPVRFSPARENNEFGPMTATTCAVIEYGCAVGPGPVIVVAPPVPD